MHAPRGLATVALLKTRLDEGKDHLTLYEPFILDALIHLQADGFLAADVKSVLLDRSGIILATDTIQTLLARCARRHLLSRRGGRFFRTTRPIPDPSIGPAREDAEREQKILGGLLRQFAAEQGTNFQSDAEALATLAAVVSENKVHLLLDESLPKPPLERFSEERKLARVVARFITDRCTSDELLRLSLQRLTDGIVLHDALMLVEMPRAAERFKNLQVFLDTSVLFSALGFHGVASGLATKEALTLFRESGARTLAFSRTLDEMRGIFSVYEQHLATTEGRLKLRPTPFSLHVLKSHLSPADIRVISATLESRLSLLGIQIREFPSRNPRYTSNEAALEKALADQSQQDMVTGRVRHDVDAIAAILTLRRGQTCRFIERSGAVFCTASGRVVQNVNRWYLEQPESGVSPIVHQFALTSIAWLKRPAVAPDLKMHELVALCRAAMRPTRKTWEKFINVLRDLRRQGTITDDETAAIVVNELTEPLLARIDDEVEPDADSIGEAIERVIDEYKRKASAGALEAIRKAEADASMAERAAETAMARAEGIQARVEGWIGGVARWAAQIIFGIGVIITMSSGVLSLPGLSDGLTSAEVKWVARVVFLIMAVLGAYSAIYGGSLTDIRTRIEEEVSKWLRRRWLTSLGGGVGRGSADTDESPEETKKRD